MRSLPLLVCVMLLVGCGKPVSPELVVDLDSAGRMSINGRPVTAAELAAHCAQQVNRYGTCVPVLLRGRDDTPLAEIHAAVNSVTHSGLGDIAYATTSEIERPPPRFMGEWMPEPPAPDATPGARDYLQVPIHSGESVPRTSVLHGAGSDSKVLIECEDDAPLSSLVEVLRQCRIMNIKTVCVSFGWSHTGGEQSVGGDSDKAADGLTGAPQRDVLRREK